MAHLAGKEAMKPIVAKQRLNFSTPDGSSKASANQYVPDYRATWGIRSVAFRHSSIPRGR